MMTNPQGVSALRIFYVCRQLRRKLRQLRLGDFHSFGQSAMILSSQLQNDQGKEENGMPAILSQIICVVAVVAISAVLVLTDKRPD